MNDLSNIYCIITYYLRMIIFSASSILSCPDKKDVKQIHVIFNRIGNDYDRLTSLFLKFSLIQVLI